jgi:hypothetical protein
MEYFYLSNLYKSYNLKGADLVRVNLTEKMDNFCDCLMLVKGAHLECWNHQNNQLKLLESFELNCEVKEFIKVRNIKGKEDALLIVTNKGDMIFFTIRAGKIDTLSRIELQGKNMDELQIVYSDSINSSGARFISIFDKNCEIIILKITQNGDLPTIEKKFSIYSLVKGVLLFSAPENLKKTKEADFVLGMVCGSQLYHHFISFVEMDSNSKDMKWVNERKDINLASRDRTEIVQEKVFEVFHLSGTVFVAFCAFSLV